MKAIARLVPFQLDIPTTGAMLFDSAPEIFRRAGAVPAIGFA
jgi:hypothetical protein